MTKQSSAFSAKKFIHLLHIFCLVHGFEVLVSYNSFEKIPAIAIPPLIL